MSILENRAAGQISNRVLGQNRFLRARSILENRAADLFKSRPLSKSLPLGKVLFRKSRKRIVQIVSLVKTESVGQRRKILRALTFTGGAFPSKRDSVASIHSKAQCVADQDARTRRFCNRPIQVGPYVSYDFANL